MAATTTGMYSGLHPASTALIATFSAVMVTARWAMVATACRASSRTAASMARTRSGVGGNHREAVRPPCA